MNRELSALAEERGYDVVQSVTVNTLPGDTAAMNRESAAAVQLYDRLLQEHPHSPKLWNERGIALHQDGRHAEAAASYERAIAAERPSRSPA